MADREANVAMSAVRVSVIVPCFNHAAFIDDNIASVLGQTHPHVELIVVDDASTDGSADRIEALQAKHGFHFLRNETNLGLNATLARGLAAATGDYVSLLASDDMICATKLEEQLAYLQRTGADGVYSTGYLLRPDGSRTVIDLGEVDRRFRAGTILDRAYVADTNGPLLQSALFRTPVLRDGFRVSEGFQSDDWALFILLLERYRIGFLNRPLFTYRQHDGNSYRQHWATLPMRVEVVCKLTPEPLRLRALGNLLSTQALYMLVDRRPVDALRTAAAAFALDPSPMRLWRSLRWAIGVVSRQAVRFARERHRRDDAAARPSTLAGAVTETRHVS
jgi:glycosyltransferase involved in cell wall biosynthesis